MKKLLYGSLGIGLIIILSLALFNAPKAQANPKNVYGCQTSSASTSPTFMTAGTATTTLTCDAYISQVNPNNYITNNVSVGSIADSFQGLFQFTASTSAGVLRVRPEISQDGVDWYPLSAPLVATAGTTTPITAVYTDYSWNVSTSTAATNGSNGGSGFGMRQHNSFQLLNINTRFVRFLFYIPPGGANGAIWAEGWFGKQMQP